MSKIRNFLWMMLLWLAMPCAAQQNEVTVTARFDTSHILVGDHLKLQLTAQTTGTESLVFELDDKEGMVNCELLETLGLQSSKKENVVTYRQDFVVTAFDTGIAVIAPVLVWADTIPVACTDTLFFFVDTLPVFVDTAAAFRDIKLPLSAYQQVTETSNLFKRVLLPIMLAIALIVLAVVFYWVWWPKLKKKRKQHRREMRRRNSGEIALGRIRDLKSKELCVRGMYKEHYSELSVILREYMDDQWDVNAMEMVTDEIMSALASLEVTEQQRLEILSFLQISDLAKYARHQPPLEENALQMDRVTQFIRDTDWQEQQRRAQQASRRKNGGQ